MLSILPKHIADEMLQGMKKQANENEGQQQQFNTMYMYRHENVRSGSQNPPVLGGVSVMNHNDNTGVASVIS